MIEIKQWVEPDLIMVLPNKDNYANTKFNRYSILIDRQMMAIHGCDEDGLVTSYTNSGRYYGLKMEGDMISVCIPSRGWVPVLEQIQAHYSDKLAEQELIGE